MTAAAWVTALAAAAMFGYGPAFCLGMWLAERRDRKKVDAPPAPVPAAELPKLEIHPSLRTHQTVARIRDRIAANEAARLDDEWEAMNR